MAALQAVLDIPELVEIILGHLPLYDLLIATRAHQSWWDIISTSPTLRNHLLTAEIPKSIPSTPGHAETEVKCNISENSPWFFRTKAPRGTILALRHACDEIQLFVPDDKVVAILPLAACFTRGAYYGSEKSQRGWVEFFNVSGDMVCRKQLWTPVLAGEKAWVGLEPQWNYVRVFNSSECEFFAAEIKLEEEGVPRPTRRGSVGSAGG